MESKKYNDFRPNFIENHILKARQLECVRDFPREMESLRHADYADGILFGCRVSSDENKAITISPGVILKAGVFYRLTVPASVPYGPSDETQYLKARFGLADADEEDISKKSAEIALGVSPAIKGEIELARFKLKEGARLRSDYTGFDDLDTEFDTLCVLHSPCAAPGGNTLLPFVTRFFAEEALSHNPENPLDAFFAMFCLQSERVTGGVLRYYLGTSDTEPFGLYKALSVKLAALKGANVTNANPARTFRKILVD
jgi:hypothetical protein